MNAPFRIGLASALAISTALPALAQEYGQYPQTQYQQNQYPQNQYPQNQYPQGSNGQQGPYQPTPQYQEQQQQYQQQQQDYQDQQDRYHAQQDAYATRREGYQQARADYDRRLADWERARADYDRRYGYGAYARRYPRPVWDSERWGAYDSASAGYYSHDASYGGAECLHNNNTAVTAGLIGALAGGVLGSNIAGHGNRTGGTVLGALVGGGIGAAVGHAHDVAKCDQRGAYWSYNDTVPYEEEAGHHSDRYAYYRRMRCRLAPAPVDADGRDYRYVRVCPDADGRYRITG